MVAFLLLVGVAFGLLKKTTTRCSRGQREFGTVFRLPGRRWLARGTSGDGKRG
jgi:hypothetical protein